VRETKAATLLAVADGVGGEAGGEIASAAAIEALARRFFDGNPKASRSDALAAAIREANDAVLATAEKSGLTGAATTLVAAAVAGNDAVIGNLGDSRAYLIREGAVRRVTEDHSGAAPSSITRFVGDPRGVQPDVFVETLEPGDRLLLCSDGLTRHLTDDEIAARAKGKDLARTVDALVALANERGGEDNVTVVMYAARGRGLFADAGRTMTNAILALLLAIVIGGAVGAIVFASGAVPTAP
jgi:PPM family protein phosphatase